MKFILGSKIEMSQKFKEDGTALPVTLIQGYACKVSEVRTLERDGYNAIQIGCGTKKKLKKPQLGHLKGIGGLRFIKEFRIKDSGVEFFVKGEERKELKRGDELDISQFKVGDFVNINGLSKGKGFQGVVKRHRFHGSPASHGHKDQLRMPGSIGATGVSKVFKGTRMAGRMGNNRVTVKNLEIVDIDKERSILAVRGAVPGARNNLLMIREGGKIIWDSNH